MQREREREREIILIILNYSFISLLIKFFIILFRPEYPDIALQMSISEQNEFSSP
jgi:hypothetical protein